MNYSKESYDRAIYLSSLGNGAHKISKEMGIPKSTIHHWIRDNQKPLLAKSPEEITKMVEAQTRVIKTYWIGKVGPMKGRKYTKEHCEKIRLAKIGELNPMWKGNKVSPAGGRARARRILPKNKSFDIHHIDGNPLNNDPSNLIILTRKQHMKMDGRLNKLILRNKGLSQ